MKAQRWRITFAKTEAMRFTGHLDLILTWERTFRRSGLPLSYSEGYNPRPVINLAAPLPLGFTSQGELGDFWLSEKVPEQSFSSALKPALPPGLEIMQIEEIASIHGNKLPTLVESARYWISLEKPYPGLAARIEGLLAASSLPRERKGKAYDLRPLVQSLSLVNKEHGSDSTELETQLSLLPGATGRPDEVLKALELDPLKAWICRMKINIKPAASKP